MTRIIGGDGSKWLADFQKDIDMPQYQHRVGAPSRPRQSDHSRWADRGWLDRYYPRDPRKGMIRTFLAGAVIVAVGVLLAAAL